jgi:hypothetical protein
MRASRVVQNAWQTGNTSLGLSLYEVGDLGIPEHELPVARFEDGQVETEELNK